MSLLAESAARARLRAPSASTVDALVARLRAALGSDRVTVAEAARVAASADYAFLSPVLSAALPGTLADVVVYPRAEDELATAVTLAAEAGCPVVARGKGTGNYGQAVPLAGGMVVDLSGMDGVLELGDGWIRAQAGATFVALEAAARRTGQEIAMFPTTVGSTIGGFLAGGAGGVGSIEHGMLWDGFVVGLDVVTSHGTVSVRGAECLPYLHAYGVNGVIATATVKLAPARRRIALMASYGTFGEAARAGLALLAQDPPPRLVSLDDPELVALYPPDERLPHGRYSLRAVVCGTGGPEADLGYLSTLAFNHVTLRAKKKRPDLCHLQVSGEVLMRDPHAVRSALPGGMLHLDAMSRNGFGGLLLAPFPGGAALYEGIALLRERGAVVVDPHTWMLGGPALAGIRTAAQANDPNGLFNPGKLPLA